MTSPIHVSPPHMHLSPIYHPHSTRPHPLPPIPLPTPSSRLPMEAESAPSPARHLRHVSSSGVSTLPSASIFSSDSGDVAHLRQPGEAAAADEVPAAVKRCVGRAMVWGAAAMVGRRKEMEDAVAVAPEFMAVTCDGVGGCAASSGSESTEISHVRFFGVYDGHGGSQVAKFCAERIHEVVAKEWETLNSEEGWQRRWEAAFCNGFEKVDDEVITESVAPDIVGSTAVVVVVSGCQIIASNCGDSRAILCRRNQTIQLTKDHKPDREDELHRIENDGGRVINWQGPRVLGVLSMSRSIGDRYMRPWVIPVPEVTFMMRSEDDECLILASDGLWDVMSNGEAGEVACRLLRRHRRNGVGDEVSLTPAQAVANHLVKLAYRKNSSDNISVIVVDFRSGTRHQSLSR